MINKLRKWSELHRPLCLYATENYFGNLSHLQFKGIYSDRELYRTQKKFIDYFNTNPCGLIWKLHPGSEEPPHRINDNIVKVKDEVKFTDILPMVDFLLLDVPATMTLQAMAMRSIPMFMLTKYGLLPEPERLMKKSCVCSRSEDELIKEIDYFLTTGIYNSDPDNKEYLKAYGGA